jgi:FtsX-like permease family/MacB-like periplasmic core domain
MGAVALRVRSDLRNRWAAWLGLALLIAVLVGGIGAIAVGARRTDSAYPRFVRETRAPDLLVFNSLDPSFARLAPSALAALPRVREVGTVEGYDVVRPAAIGLFAPRDGVVGQRFWTRKLLAGRIPDVSDPSGATISFTTAEHLHLHVGDDLPIVVQTQSGGTPETVEVHVDGIDAAVTEFPPRAGTDAATDGADTVWATPAFNARHGDLASDVGSALRLDHGSRDVGSVQAEVTRLGHGRPTESFGVDAQSAGTQRAIHLQAVALWILAGLLALAALLIVSQLLARQTAMESTGYHELRALGMTTRQIWAVGMARTALIAAVASSAGVALAAALSPVFPIGLAGIAEPHPGFSIDAITLAVTAGLSALILLVAAAWPNWRAAARSSWVIGRSEPGTGRSRVVALARRSGGPATLVAGVGFALERRPGRLAAPIRSTVAASVIGIAALAAAVVFSSSLANLIATPRLYGVQWDAIVSSTNGDGSSLAKARSTLASDHDIQAVSEGYTGVPLTSGRRALSGEALDPVRGSSLQPTRLTGRMPLADNEVALGSLDLQSLHAKVGDTIPIVIAGIGAPRRYHVVGTAVFPDLDDLLDLGHGVVLTTSALRAVVGSEMPPPDSILVQFRPGIDRPAAVTRLDRVVGQRSPDLNAAAPQQPVDLVNFGRVQYLPLLVGALLAVLAIGTLIHLLYTSIRARRADLAILQVLGFVPRQVRRTITWQTNTIAALALVLGLPVGVVVGRWLWIAFSDQLGVETVIPTPWAGGGALIVAVLATVQVIAVIPARTAARTEPSQILRPQP